MNCKKVKNKLSAYQDNQLPESQRVQMQEHLKICQQCSRALENLNLVWDELGQVEPIESAPFFWTRLSQKLETKKQRVNFNVLQWLPISVTATIILVFGLLIGIYFGKTISLNSASVQKVPQEQEFSDLISFDSIDEFTGESVSDVYLSLLSENSQ